MLDVLIFWLVVGALVAYAVVQHRRTHRRYARLDVLERGYGFRGRRR